jgi:hypothetical protein
MTVGHRKGWSAGTREISTPGLIDHGPKMVDLVRNTKFFKTN